MLASILKNKYNEWLRKRYKNNLLLFDFADVPDPDNQLILTEEADEIKREYEAVRREIGRLLKIYREVTVRYYVQGHSIEKISKDLNISVGTVKSRLSNARSQIKEGIIKMNKYSEISFMPKSLSIGIWGNSSFSGEPFSLLSSSIEENILILAYKNPMSIRDISNALGMPAVFVEPLIKKLIVGELMGETSGGLVYTRCFIMNYKDSFGNISAQEAIAEKYSEIIWEIANNHLGSVYNCDEFKLMSEKQKATLCLFVLQQSLNRVMVSCRPIHESCPEFPPERPNGGRWLASGKVFEHQQRQNNKYDGSGPVCVSWSSEKNGKPDCQMFDTQSCFGDAHWMYGSLKYKLSLQTILRFYASLATPNIKPDCEYIYELIPDFEKLHIIKRNKDGNINLDIPAMTFDSSENLLFPAIQKITHEVFDILKSDILKLYEKHKNRVPKHVDEWQYYETEGVTGALSRAIMLEIVNRKLFPFSVIIGKTPIIFLRYKRG